MVKRRPSLAASAAAAMLPPPPTATATATAPLRRRSAKKKRRAGTTGVFALVLSLLWAAATTTLSSSLQDLQRRPWRMLSLLLPGCDAFRPPISLPPPRTSSCDAAARRATRTIVALTARTARTTARSYGGGEGSSSQGQRGYGYQNATATTATTATATATATATLELATAGGSATKEREHVASYDDRYHAIRERLERQYQELVTAASSAESESQVPTGAGSDYNYDGSSSSNGGSRSSTSDPTSATGRRGEVRSAAATRRRQRQRPGRRQSRTGSTAAGSARVASTPASASGSAMASNQPSASSSSWSIGSSVGVAAAKKAAPQHRLSEEQALQQLLLPRRDDDAGPTPTPSDFLSWSTRVSAHEKQEQASEQEAAVTRARYLLLIAAALYGTNFSCVKLLLMGHDHPLPVGASSTVRFGLAALATAPWLVPHSLKECRLNSSSVAAIVAGFEVGAWNSVGYVAQAIGLETTEASKSAFLCSLAVVVVPLLDYVVKKKSMHTKQVVGTLLALAGVAILELGGLWGTGGGGGATAAPLLSSGDLASLVQPLAFGMGFWRMEAAMHEHPHQALRSTAAQLFAVFVGSAVYCYGFESAGMDHPTLTLDVAREWLGEPAIMAGLLWTGVVTTALTVYMETMALETLSAAETTLIFSTEPLWGTACAAAVMGEQLGIDAGIGAVMIVCGCIFSNLGWSGIREHFAFPGMAPARLADGSSPGDGAAPPLPPSTATFAGTSTLAGGVAATLASAWNNLSVGAKVLAIQAEDLLQDLGFLAER